MKGFSKPLSIIHNLIRNADFSVETEGRWHDSNISKRTSQLIESDLIEILSKIVWEIAQTINPVK